MPISEEQKTNARNLSPVSCEHRLIAALVTVTYNDKGERERRDMVDIK
jgi:hypothetical protein